jgi:glycosyltransferase involved in cell wall biosynthesis
MIIGICSGDRVPAEKSFDGKVHWGGAGWARLAQYLPYLKTDHTQVVEGTLVWFYDHFRIMGDNGLQDVDVIFVQRLMHDGLANHIRKAKAAGQVIINDVDDWYWGLAPSNGAWLASHPKHNTQENTNHYRSVICAGSVITVSTPYLANRIKDWMPKCPIEILPNTVDTARFTKHDHTNNTPVVGWVGSTAHRSGDLEILSGIMTTTQNELGFSLYHGGHHESSPWLADAFKVSRELVSTKPTCDPQDYPSLLQMDIGIAPLSTRPFNEAKSEIKLMEYSASGIPWIASSSSSYSSFQKEMGAGRIATRPREWIRHLTELCGDWHLRHDEGEKLYERVKARDIKFGAARLLDVAIHAEP